MSAAVHTANTPGSARAPSTLIPTIRACAWFARTTSHVQLVREGDVAGKAAAADHQGRVFQTLDRASDPLVMVFVHAIEVPPRERD